MEWATLPLKRYAQFTGRSRRKEYWMFVLLLFVAGLVLSIVEGIAGFDRTIGGAYGPLTALFWLATLVPSIAVGIRRLHDIDKSGWWLMIGYGPAIVGVAMLLLGAAGAVPALVLLGIAGIGFIVLLVFSVLEGTRGPNAYGPDPKGEDLAATFA